MDLDTLLLSPKGALVWLQTPSGGLVAVQATVMSSGDCDMLAMRYLPQPQPTSILEEDLVQLVGRSPRTVLLNRLRGKLPDCKIIEPADAAL